MNRVFLFLLLSVFVFAACEGPEGRDGRDGRDGLDLYTESFTYLIEQDDWIYDDDGFYFPGGEGYNGYYYAECDLPELTQYRYDNAFIAAYMYLNPNNKNEGYVPLADSYPYEDPNYIEDYVWTDHYTYICSPGKIIFTAASSDFPASASEDWVPPRKLFRVVLIH